MIDKVLPNRIYIKRNGTLTTIHKTNLPGPPYVVLDVMGMMYTINGRNLNDKIDSPHDLIKLVD